MPGVSVNSQVTRALVYTTRYWWLPGAAGLGVLILLLGLPFLVLLVTTFQEFDVSSLLTPYVKRVIWFTFYQACLSTLLSVMLAIPVALALSRHRSFPGRALLINLFSVSLIIPSIVAVYGIVAIYGRTGWLKQAATAIGFDWQPSIYGLSGILIAHVFFNLPLAVRIFLQALDTVPSTTWRLSAQLGLRTHNIFTVVEWPAIRQQVAGVVLLVFSLCFTSFAIVMTLGGGPKATTIEVAIYQALRFDFNLPLAMGLALVQTSICIALILFVNSQTAEATVKWSATQGSQRYHRQSMRLRVIDTLLITMAFGFVLLPLLALLLAGVNSAFPKVLMMSSTWDALLNTVLVSLVSGVLSVTLSCLLLSTSCHLRVRLNKPLGGRALELTGMGILVVPPVVLGTGLFVLLRPFADVFSLALLLVVLVNALMGLPFVLRIMSAPLMQSAQRYDRLCASLSMKGITRLKLVEWPMLRKPLGLSLAIATTLSAGDLTVIALFGSERLQTLPLLLYQRMGSYRMQDAAVTALLLLGVSLCLFWIINRVVGGRDA